MSRQHFTFAVLGASLTSVALLTAPMKAADNPFARWERLKVQTQVAEEQVRQPALTAEASHRDTDAFEYFSPNTQPSAASGAGNTNADKPAVAATAVKKERLAVRQTSKSASTDSSSDDNWGVFYEVSAQKSAKAAESDENVTRALFVDGQTRDAGIRQTNANSAAEAAVSGQDNPFAEFLVEDSQPSQPDSNPFQEPITTQEVQNETPKASQAAAAVADTGVSLPASLAGPQSPTVTLEWVHHEDFNVGQECRCDLVIENSGTSIVRNVVAEAVLPQGLEVISSEPAPTAAGGGATWTFGELQPGQKRTVELVVVPKTQGDIQLNAFVRMTGGSFSSVSVREPKLAVNVEGPEAVEVGQLVHYTVHVANPGTGKAHNVAIQAVVPEGLEHRHGQKLTIDIGTLNPGEVRRARLSLTGISGGDNVLAVRAIGDGNLSDQITETVSVAEPRLNIGLRGPQNITAGQSAVYELVVINEGNVDSNNVRVSYRIPAGYEFVRADAGGKPGDDSTIDWFVGTLEREQARRFSLTLRPTVPGTATHQAGVISEHGRMTMAEYSTDVQGSAELKLDVAASKRQLGVGEEGEFELRISNSGTSPAANVALSCELPSGLELVDISGPSEFVENGGAVIFRSMPELDPGKTVTFVLKTQCLRAGNHKVRARVASDSISDALVDEAATSGVRQ